MIIDSLNILSGGRFSKDMIRKNQKFSYVEMSLFLPQINSEDNIIVSREINLAGKNVCKIDGRLVSVSELKSFMNKVIDIHGQNENQSLLNVQNHLKLLDKFAGNKLEEKLARYKNLYLEYLEVKKKLEENYGDEKEKQRRLDLLKYEISEIEEADLKENEEEELYEKRKIILNSEKIAKGLENSFEYLDENVIDNLSNTIRELEKIASYNQEYEKVLERIRSSYYELEEAKNDVSYLRDDISFDEEEQEKIEKRIDLINLLKRKYGNNINEILEFYERTKEEIRILENNEEYVNELKNTLIVLESKLKILALSISDIRKEYASLMSEKINKELLDLEMKKAVFEVFVDSKIGKYSLTGIDEVEFLISTNVGSDMKSLNKIASGGEMSRIMLAIKNVLADIDDTPVMVFDEIDTGISGNAGVVTGEKIKNISEKHQVICITHLASIAAKGDYNYYIYKETKQEDTQTKIKQLNENEVLNEIARISSGSVTDISLELAKQLRNKKIA